MAPQPVILVDPVRHGAGRVRRGGPQLGLAARSGREIPQETLRLAGGAASAAAPLGLVVADPRRRPAAPPSARWRSLSWPTCAAWPCSPCSPCRGTCRAWTSGTASGIERARAGTPAHIRALRRAAEGSSSLYDKTKAIHKRLNEPPALTTPPSAGLGVVRTGCRRRCRGRHHRGQLARADACEGREDVRSGGMTVLVPFAWSPRPPARQHPPTSAERTHDTNDRTTPRYQGYWLFEIKRTGVLRCWCPALPGRQQWHHLNAPIVGGAACNAGYWRSRFRTTASQLPGQQGFYGSTVRCASTSRSSAWRPLPTTAATGWLRRTAASSPTAMPASTGPWRWKPLNKPIVGMATTRTVVAIGSWRPATASSPVATPVLRSPAPSTWTSRSSVWRRPTCRRRRLLPRRPRRRASTWPVYDAHFSHSRPVGIVLNKPVVGIAGACRWAQPTWLVAFRWRDLQLWRRGAQFAGSAGRNPDCRYMVSMAAPSRRIPGFDHIGPGLPGGAGYEIADIPEA